MTAQIPRLLNKTLSSDFIKLRLLEPPIAIPVNQSGIVVGADKAEKIHYGAPVYSENDEQIYFLEFNEMLFAGLLGYARRHSTLDDLEILFHKKDDGILRMTLGSESTLESNKLNELRGKFKRIISKVSQFYIDNLGYQVHDFGGKVNA